MQVKHRKERIKKEGERVLWIIRAFLFWWGSKSLRTQGLVRTNTHKSNSWAMVYTYALLKTSLIHIFKTVWQIKRISTQITSFSLRTKTCGCFYFPLASLSLIRNACVYVCALYSYCYHAIPCNIQISCILLVDV